MDSPNESGQLQPQFNATTFNPSSGPHSHDIVQTRISLPPCDCKNSVTDKVRPHPLQWRTPPGPESGRTLDFLKGGRETFGLQLLRKPCVVKLVWGPAPGLARRQARKWQTVAKRTSPKYVVPAPCHPLRARKQLSAARSVAMESNAPTLPYHMRLAGMEPHSRCRKNLKHTGASGRSA